MKQLSTNLLTLSFLVILTLRAYANPENIKPGSSYFSDDYSVKGKISQLGEEKNFEEIFKNYEYYEAIYDERGRISIFKIYKRGEVILTEEYSYNPDGKSGKKKIVEEGKSVKVVPLKF